MRRTRSAVVALLFFVVCVGALFMVGCSGGDDSTRATAVADEAGAALKESISIETSAARLVLGIRMVPEFSLKRQDTRALGKAGLKTLDEADRLRADAQKQLQTAQRLYASIDGMDASDEFRKWAGMTLLFANKWGEAINHDAADSALRRRALVILADGATDTKDKEFTALIQEISALSQSKQTLMREVNRLSAEAVGYGKSLK